MRLADILWPFIEVNWRIILLSGNKVIQVDVASWPSGLGKGLQSPVRRFDSARRLTLYFCSCFVVYLNSD